MTRSEKVITGFGLLLAAFAISPDLRRWAFDGVKLATTALSNTPNDADEMEWIEIDVSDLTIH